MNNLYAQACPTNAADLEIVTKITLSNELLKHRLDPGILQQLKLFCEDFKSGNSKITKMYTERHEVSRKIYEALKRVLEARYNFCMNEKRNRTGHLLWAPLIHTKILTPKQHYCNKMRKEFINLDIDMGTNMAMTFDYDVNWKRWKQLEAANAATVYV